MVKKQTSRHKATPAFDDNDNVTLKEIPPWRKLRWLNRCNEWNFKQETRRKMKEEKRGKIQTSRLMMGEDYTCFLFYLFAEL